VSSERIERIRAALAAFERTGEVAPGLLAPDFELRQASSIVDTAGVFTGPEAFGRAIGELSESFADLSFRPERWLDGPNGEVVALVHVRGRGRASGMEIDNNIAWVFTFEGEQVRHVEVYEEPDAALRAHGLENS
jgi:ketosteroid isomerase-like protein